MIENIRNEFIRFIVSNDLINNNDRVVVGLSGGPDSVCLLYLLNSIKKDFNIKIVAVHINHMLRGEAADCDEEFSKNICNELGVDFFCKKIDVNKYSKEKSISSEMAGREVRYSFFNEVMKKLKFNKIATAHNANDQAETIIMRMMRGTGLEGLCGIPVKREEKYIRPILFMKREKVENYCKEIGVMPRIDKSNLERMYSRNKVRLDILPYMKENFNSDIVDSINRMGILLQEDNNYISKKVEEIYEEICYLKGESIYIKKDILNMDRTIYMRVIRKAIKNLQGSSHDFELKHIQDIIDLFSYKTGKQIDLPNKLIAKNIYGDICLVLKGEDKNKKVNKICMDKNDVINKIVDFNNYIIEFEILENNKNINYNKNSYIKYFNFDKINGNIIIRYRENGDKIVPIGLNGRKKVKDIFIDMKIPKDERDFIPIVQFDEEVAWIVDLKISDKYKVNNETNKILKIKFKERISTYV